MSNTLYSNEPILVVHERSVIKVAQAVLEYREKGWIDFSPPFNVVYEKQLEVGKWARRSGGYSVYMRRKVNDGKEHSFYSTESKKR